MKRGKHFRRNKGNAQFLWNEFAAHKRHDSLAIQHTNVDTVGAKFEQVVSMGHGASNCLIKGDSSLGWWVNQINFYQNTPQIQFPFHLGNHTFQETNDLEEPQKSHTKVNLKNLFLSKTNLMK
jgi:hypothetical protein